MTELTRRVRRDRKNISVINTGEGITEQSHRDECDINTILHDYARTGFMRHAKANAGRYDDVSAVDFQEAQIVVANVKSMFEALPSNIRAEFNGDPVAFLGFVQDPANGDELAARGLLVGNDGIDIQGAYTNSMTKQQYADMLRARSTASEEVSSEAAVDQSEATKD